MEVLTACNVGIKTTSLVNIKAIMVISKFILEVLVEILETPLDISGNRIQTLVNLAIQDLD